MGHGMVAGGVGQRLGFAVVVLLGGCLADGSDGGILVLKNVHADETCTASSSETEVAVGHGTLDLLLPSNYVFIAQMKSRIMALDGQEDQRTILVQGAKVDIAFPDSSLFTAAELGDLQASHLTRFKSLFSAVLVPDAIQDGSFVLIPAGLVQAIAAKTDFSKAVRIEAVATFTIEGDMSGTTVVSQAFTYPVTIGNSVTVNVPGTCDLPKSFGMPRVGYSCNPAQDGIVDCCRGPSGNLVCPATVAAM
jgi:hypothetical protein